MLDGEVDLYNLTDTKPLYFDLKPSAIMSYDGRVYMKVCDKVYS